MTELIEFSCDILIVGGSTGGVAAALAAAAQGANVIVLEETHWLGGQLTTQGVSHPDEQRYIETFGGTRRYMSFRTAVRNYYKTNYKLKEAAQKSNAFNPGSCWVTRLSYEPKVGLEVLRNMVEPFERSGNLRIYYRTRAIACEMGGSDGHEISAVRAQQDTGVLLRIRADYILDATDTGDLLPFCGQEGSDWVIGAESIAETGEPDAQPTPRPDWVQPFTFPFALEWSPNTVDTNVIEPPEDYESLRRLQKYHVLHGAITGVFKGSAPWWRYRRILAASNFADPRVPSDVSMINTAGNDYYGGNILGANAGSPNKQMETLARARRASLGYVYWLQTECPREAYTADDPEGEYAMNPVLWKSVLEQREDAKHGYPEFKLRLDIFDTPDGCSIRPYIRESRRIRSLRPILEQEIVVKDFSGRDCRGDLARAAFMWDTIGVGHYALDIHPNGHGEPNHYVPTRPFQIPLGALIPVRLENLLPACKNLGTTHLSNGAYRLHPIEWNIGESAGLLAIYCLQNKKTPRQVYKDKPTAQAFQNFLLQQGISLHWYVDVVFDHPAYMAVQTLAGTGVELGNPKDLNFRPNEPISEVDWRTWATAMNRNPEPVFTGTRAAAAIRLTNKT